MGCRSRLIELALGDQSCLHRAVSGNGLRQEIEIPLRDDTPLARLPTEVFHLMIVSHLASRSSGDGDRYLACALHEANGVSSMGNYDIRGADALDQLCMGHERRMRAWWDNLRRSRLREDTVLGAERNDRSDQPIEGPCAHANCYQDVHPSIELADYNAVWMRAEHRWLLEQHPRSQPCANLRRDAGRGEDVQGRDPEGRDAEHACSEEVGDRGSRAGRHNQFRPLSAEDAPN